MLNVFHISDLHYTSDITGHVRDAAVSSVTAMLNLAAELKAQGILGRDLCVCITGDLVQTGAAKPDGQLTDFQAVNEDFLVPLMATLDIDAKSVYIVPGNHEMDRDAVAPDARLSGGNVASKKPCEGDLHADLCTKLSHYFDFIENYGYQSVTRSSPRMAMFDRNGQYIVCINGLVGSYSLPGTQDKGELFVLPSEMGGALAAIPDFSIVLTHHPLSWFTDECGVDLKSSLSERRCRLMTGHIHSQGVDWLDTVGGGMAIIQAGASAERNKGNKVAVAWYPPSDSAAVRHYTYNQTLGRYDRTETSATRVVPNSAQAFFERSEAFFDPDLIKLARTGAFTDCSKELTAALGQDPSKYIVPDLILYSADEFSGKRVRVESFHSNNHRKVISGDELSGKTSLIYYAAMKANESIDNTKIHLVIDYRGLSAGRDIYDTVIRKIQSFGLKKSQADYILNVGLLEIWFDNFDSDDASSLAKFTKFFDEFELNWNVAVRGGQHFMPSRAPTVFPKDGISYYRMAEITLPTALRMIDVHDNGKIQERPRAVVERVFRSINNLRAPRTVFYVNNLVDLFLSDGSVEPLNRYLLIENLLSEKIREAHKLHLPNQAVDMEMLDTFIGSIAYFLLEKEQPYLSKADYFNLVEEFIERKGLQPKRFDASIILNVLTDSFVLRDYDGSFGFMMISVEDYFLAKHVGRDESFRKRVMSADGLLTLPSVAEYYVAQNPSDGARIGQIFEIIEEFENEIWPLIEKLKPDAIAVIKQAAPGNPAKQQDEIVELLGDAEDIDRDKVLKVSDSPESIGKTKRVKHSVEERGAIFLQLASSILGVTRTLDQSDRVKIFHRLRKLLDISFVGTPYIAQHLADGGEVKLRGMSFKADYVGPLAIQEDRFYIILRGMLFNVMKQFAVWAGSPSFFNAAVLLREDENDELISAALLAQNIEADLSEAMEFIPKIIQDHESMIVKEILVRLFVDAMTLVPLERAEETKAVERLVDATIAINPPKNGNSSAMIEVHKIKVRQHYIDTIGLNTYVGKLVKPKKEK